MIHEENKALKRFLMLLLCVCVLASSIYVIVYGACVDTALLSMFRMKASNGDIPMKEIYGPYALSAWLLSLEYKLLDLLKFKYEYGILTTKILGVLFQFCIAVWFSVYEIRRGKEKNRTILCSILFFVFLADYLYCFVSHYTVIYWATFMVAV